MNYYVFSDDNLFGTISSKEYFAWRIIIKVDDDDNVDKNKKNKTITRIIIQGEMPK